MKQVNWWRPTSLIAILAVFAIFGFFSTAFGDGDGPGSSNGLLTIRATSNGVQKLGRFHPDQNVKLIAAIRAFGKPTKRQTRYGATACFVTWKPLSLRMVFVNYGGGSACTPRLGIATEAVIQGKYAAQWQTDRGLRVGDSRVMLLELYPAAGPVEGRYWLVTGHTHIGTNGYYPVIAAKLVHGHIDNFELRISNVD